MIWADRSFSASLLSSRRNWDTNERLERIDEAVDWERLGRVVAGIYASARRQAELSAELTMVKVLLLEQWYNLSDPQMEEALGDRLSFRRFVGLGLQDDTAGSCERSAGFWTELARRGLSERLFGELARPVGGAGNAGEGRDVAGRNVGGSPGTATVDRCGTGSEE